jgi:fatty-acyl-CoA synthase
MPNATVGPPATLSELLARTVAAHGDRPAVIDSRRTFTWREVGSLAEGFASQLQVSGIRRGDRVAVWLPNSADYLALIFAVARLGAVVVHLNSRFRAHEVGSVFRRATPCMLVTDFSTAADFAEVLAQVQSGYKASLSRILVRGGEPSTRTLDGIPVEPLRSNGTVADAARPDDACAIFTTTGSTGEPKLAVHGQRGIVEHHFFAARRLGFDHPGAMLLANLPFCGVGGHCWMMMAVVGGAGIVLLDSADLDGLIRRRRITHMSGFADVLAWCVEAARGRRFDSMRVFGIARSPFVDNDAVFAAAEGLGLTLRAAYGSTEANSCFAIAPEGWHASTGGTPSHPDSRFVIRDLDTGLELPEGEPGALLIAGPTLFLSYYNDPDATAAAWTEDGMFRTGDRAYRLGDGFVFLGRNDESIRLAGFLVDPAEIETFLCEQPGVAAARVVSADTGSAARAVAFVVAQRGCVLIEADLLEACRDQIASYKVPARIVALDEFPVSDGPNGRKIRLGALREMAATLARQNSG